MREELLDAIRTVDSERMVLDACRELELNEMVTNIVLNHHRAGFTKGLVEDCTALSYGTGWTMDRSEEEIEALDLTAKHQSLTIRLYVLAVIYQATRGHLPFQAEP